jgi:hypothetical protein
MTLMDELRTLQAPETAPDFSRAIMARIERIEEPAPVAEGQDAITVGRFAPMLATLGSIAAGIALIMFSGVIATTFGPMGRAMATAMPPIPNAVLGPIGLVAGVLLYLSGLWLSVSGSSSSFRPSRGA